MNDLQESASGDVETETVETVESTETVDEVSETTAE